MPSPLKKIQDLVYQGMVLDEHGAWIPLAEKLRKEKAFLRHLERGEILVDGVWCRLADLPQLSDELDETRDVRHPGAAPSAPPAQDVPAVAPRLTPEETVSFSTETLKDFSLPTKAPESSISPDDDFPPETKVFSIVRTPQPPADRTVIADAAAEQMVTGETQAYIIPGRQEPPVAAPRQDAVKPSMEYQATVLYNTRLLKKSLSGDSAPAGKVDGPAAPRQTAASRKVNHDDDDDVLLRKKSPPFWLIMLFGVAGIVALAAVWLFM